MNTYQLSDLIARRRSIKPVDMDATKEVSQELWETLFEAANWAPNHGHTEPWRFSIYRGDARSTIAKALQEAYQAETPEQDFRPEKFEKMGLNPLSAHAVVCIICERGNNEKIPQLEEIEAVACAVQNLHLTATSAELGVFWSSPAISYGKTFANAIALKQNQQCLGLLYIGYPKEGKLWPKSTRRPASDKITWVE